jgi:hypothetical protein
MSVEQMKRQPEPSHRDLINFIGGRFDSIEARLERGEKRFDRIEEKMEKADDVRSEMVAEISSVQATVSLIQQSSNAAANPPWWLGWKPVAIALTLALFAGAGLTALAIAGLDIVPKLTAIKNAIQP